MKTGKELTAADARNLTSEIDLTFNVKKIREAIVERAKAGYRTLPNPFLGCRVDGMNREAVQKLLIQKFVSLGYEYRKHQRPPGSQDPRENDWDDLKW